MSSYILGRRAAPAPAIGFASRVHHHPTGELITYSGDGHLISFGNTGSGKSAGPVICNALTHPGQLIVLDPKGEVYDATAEARRAMGQGIHVLDLRDEDPLPGSLNPLDLAMRCGTDVAAIARSFAVEMIERSFQTDRFWDDFAETAISGACAYLLADAKPEERRVSALFDLFNDDDVGMKLAVMLDVKGKVTNRAAQAAFLSLLNLPDRETRPCVVGTVQSHLRLFDSDLTRRLTDSSSMDVDALIAGKPQSLYIIVPPFRIKAYRPLLRMWLSGLILAMTRRKAPPKERTLMLCDEAGELGSMDALLTATTLLRSFGLTVWTFFQNTDQLKVYGTQANTILDNAGVIQIFGARNRRMAKDLADIVGNISPDDILNMKSDEQFLLMEGKALRCKQVRYYNDILFHSPPLRSVG